MNIKHENKPSLFLSRCASFQTVSNNIIQTDSLKKNSYSSSHWCEKSASGKLIVSLWFIFLSYQLYATLVTDNADFVQLNCI